MAAIHVTLRPYYVTGQTAFYASPGMFVQVDASAAAVSVFMPLQALVQDGDWLIVKKVDSSANNVTILPQGTDKVDGGASNTVSGQNQGRKIWPVSDATYGIGWITF